MRHYKLSRLFIALYTSITSKMDTVYGERKALLNVAVVYCRIAASTHSGHYKQDS